MENKHVGWLVLGIAIVVVAIIFLFNSTLKDIVESSCTIAHGGNYCPMYETIDRQTYLALGIVGLLILLGITLIFAKPREKIVVKRYKEKEKKKEIDTSGLNNEEKEVLRIIRENGAIFQADLIDKTGYGKAKMTRIIDRLEGRGIVERKRRGLTNVVVMKD